MEDPLAQQAELIITSPMRRTIQTALATVGWLVEKGVKIQADAHWQGTTLPLAIYCDGLGSSYNVSGSYI